MQSQIMRSNFVNSFKGVALLYVIYVLRSVSLVKMTKKTNNLIVKSQSVFPLVKSQNKIYKILTQTHNISNRHLELVNVY